MIKNNILSQIEKRNLDISKGEIEPCMLRGCFQMTCTEWNMTTMDEKTEALKELITNGDFTTSKLALMMLDTCTTKYNKKISILDLILGMGAIIDHLLKDRGDKIV